MLCNLETMILGRVFLFAAFCGVMTGCGGDEGPATIRILALNRPQTRTERWVAGNVFSPRSGIEVIHEVHPPDVFAAKLNGAVLSGSDRYDLVHYDGRWLGRLVAAGAVERLDTKDYLGESKCSIRWGDFLEPVSYATCRFPVDLWQVSLGKTDRYKDTPVYGMPWATECQVLYYRPELLAELEVAEPPETWEEFAGLALRLNRPPTRYGAFTQAGKMAGGIMEGFLPIFWSFGGRLWDAENRRVVGVLEGLPGVRALEFYTGWNARLGIVPAESAGWGDDEVFKALEEDKVAMGLFWARFGARLEPGAAAKSAGKWAYAPAPGVKNRRTGRILRATMSGCLGIAISSNSKHKRESWEYMKWLLSGQTQKVLIDDPQSAFVSARKDLSGYTAARNQRNRTVLDSLTHMRHYWNVPESGEMIDLVRDEAHRAFTGLASARDALSGAAVAVQRVVDGR